jgi:hypothetical protein
VSWSGVGHVCTLFALRLEGLCGRAEATFACLGCACRGSSLTGTRGVEVRSRSPSAKAAQRRLPSRSGQGAFREALKRSFASVASATQWKHWSIAEGEGCAPGRELCTLVAPPGTSGSVTRRDCGTDVCLVLATAAGYHARF